MADRSVNINIRATDKATPKVKGLTDRLRNLSAKGFLALGASITAVTLLVSKFTKAATRQEDAIAGLNAQLRINGEVNANASEELQKHAAALQKRTKFGDESIIELQSELATYGMTAEQIKMNTELTLDLAAAKKINLVTASQLIGKAFKGETGTLSRYGLIIEKGLKGTEKFAAVQKLLAEQFGGRAAAEARTFGGRITQISNSFGDLVEVVGMFITQNKAVGEVLNVVGGAIGIVSKFLKGYQSRTDDATKATKEYTDALEDERKALDEVAKQHVITQQKIALSVAQTELLNRFKGAAAEINNVNALIDEGGDRLDEYAAAGGAVRAELIRLVKNVRLEQERLDTLLRDKITVKGYEDITSAVSDLTQATEEMGETSLSASAKKQAALDRQTAALEFYSEKEKKILEDNARIADEQYALIEEGLKEREENKVKLVQETNDKIIQNEKNRNEILRQIKDIEAQRNIDNARKQLAAIQSLEQQQLQNQQDFLREQLTKEDFNWSERGAILDDIEDKTEDVQSTIASTVMTPVDIEKAIQKMKAYATSLKDVEGAEDVLSSVNETIKALFTELDTLPAGAGKAFFENIINVEEAKALGKTFASALTNGIQEQLNTSPPVKINAEFNITGQGAAGFDPISGEG
jgi:chromosome segregation ATPase